MPLDPLKTVSCSCGCARWSHVISSKKCWTARYIGNIELKFDGGRL